MYMYTILPLHDKKIYSTYEYIDTLFQSFQYCKNFHWNKSRSDTQLQVTRELDLAQER